MPERGTREQSGCAGSRTDACLWLSNIRECSQDIKKCSLKFIIHSCGSPLVRKPQERSREFRHNPYTLIYWYLQSLTLEPIAAEKSMRLRGIELSRLFPCLQSSWGYLLTSSGRHNSGKHSCDQWEIRSYRSTVENHVQGYKRYQAEALTVAPRFLDDANEYSCCRYRR